MGTFNLSFELIWMRVCELLFLLEFYVCREGMFNGDVHTHVKYTYKTGSYFD